jgi:diacylglycerol kinase
VTKVSQTLVADSVLVAACAVAGVLAVARLAGYTVGGFQAACHLYFGALVIAAVVERDRTRRLALWVAVVVMFVAEAIPTVIGIAEGKFSR